MLSHVTFTGWDRHTDLTELQTWLEDCPQATVEIAVLYSSRQDDDDRYPEWGQAIEILTTAKAAGQRTAVHICGRAARELVSSADTTGLDTDGVVVPVVLPFEAAGIVHLADRVQVNVFEDTWQTGEEKYRRAFVLAQAFQKSVIVQSRERRAWPSVAHLGPGAERMVSFLFDRSGGRGESLLVQSQGDPSSYPTPVPHRFVGYAGGLGPDNIAAFMPRIYAPGKPERYWIDMETGIRESFSTPKRRPDDPPPATYVSLVKCQRVMSAVGPWLEGRR